MPAGRPSKYKPEFCDLVIELGKKGKTITQMACAMGVMRETVWDWRQKNPEFSNAIKTALQHSQDWWEKLGQEGARGNVDNFNSSAYIWQTKNRFPKEFRDKHEIEHSGELDVNVIIGGAIDEDSES